MISKTRAWLLCGAAVLLLVGGGCATTDAMLASTEKMPNDVAVPSNYRQVVAVYFVAYVKTGKMLEAEISHPGMGAKLSVDDPRPIVCIHWRERGQFADQSYALGFMFEKGKVAETFNPDYIDPAAGALGAAILNSATCGLLSYSPFPEIMRSR